jgi:hypothetical protein
VAAAQHGSRWLYEPPTEEQVKEWFRTVNLHTGMVHEPYFGGIVVIGASEKVKVNRQKPADGSVYVQEIEQQVYVPYVKVDTRIAYFWDYVRHLNEGDIAGRFVGVIEPVEQRRITDPKSAFFNGHLPDGYAIHPVRNQDDSFNRYLVGTFRVAIYERQSYGERIAGRPAMPLLQGIGSKQVSLARKYADDNAMMKAETGAIGRALGVAGILVVGTGVATAEDIQESMAATPGAGAVSDASVPDATLPGEDGGGGMPEGVPEEAPPAQNVTTPEGDDDAMRERALDLQKTLEADYPEVWEAYKAWWNDRKFGRLSELSGPALKGAVVKLERDLDAAKQAAS